MFVMYLVYDLRFGILHRSQRRRHLGDNIVFADGGLPGGGGDTSADDLGY